MATKWDKVEVKTERVIDENPEVWVAAARKALDDKDYNETLDDAQQAIQFANKAGNRSILPECYALQIFACYELGDNFNAKKIKDANFSQGLKDFLLKNTKYVVAFRRHDNNEWTPLWLEMIKSWIKTANLYNIENYADLIDDRFLADNATDNLAIKAAEKNSLTCLEKLYTGGYNLSSVRNGLGDNLTMLALSNSSIETSNFLLDKKINNVNDRDYNKSSALMMTDNAQIAERLIAAGADIEAKNDLGCTALMLAAGAGYTEVVKVLIERGANINASAKEGYTPLMSAVANGRTDAAKLLIEAGTNVNAKNDAGLTALLFAVKTGKLDKVNLLIRAKADINAENNQGVDALALSFYEGALEISRALLNAGANPNKLYDGKTLLHNIAKGRHWEYKGDWQLLLSYNVDVNLKDRYGWTALEYSLDHEWTFSDELDMARALVKNGAEVTGDTRYIMRKHNIETSKLYNNESSNIATKLFKNLFR